jgi:hypothetical protein
MALHLPSPNGSLLDTHPSGGWRCTCRRPKKSLLSSLRDAFKKNKLTSAPPPLAPLPYLPAPREGRRLQGRLVLAPDMRGQRPEPRASNPAWFQIPQIAFLQISETAFLHISETAFLQTPETAFLRIPETAFLQISETALLSSYPGNHLSSYLGNRLS